jgi:two-component system phosphate regulon sensor histidine kinase PhoR
LTASPEADTIVAMRLGRNWFVASIFTIAPVLALVVLGILVLAFRRETVDTTLGILILSFCVALSAGAITMLRWLKRASDLSQLQLDFLSKVSHEFKTPLTSIRMFTETLAGERPLTDEQRQHCLRMLQGETGRLDTMIGRLLDFGRMEAGRMSYDRQPESVQSVVDATLQAFEPIRIRDGIHLETTVAADLPRVLADRTMLSQALLNLLQNAAKYGGDDRAVRLDCTATQGTVRFAVSDTGPGIPRRERRRIFERFYRLDDRLSRRQEGSGLGLAIVRHVAQAHGGRVTVRDRAGGGSEFAILLPASP